MAVRLCKPSGRYPRQWLRWRLNRQREVLAGDEEAGNPAALPYRNCGTGPKDAGTIEGHQDAENPGLVLQAQMAFSHRRPRQLRYW